MRADRPRLGVPAWARSFAAAGGAVAGVLLAVPVGSFLLVVLFERLGTAIIRDISSGALADDLSGVEAVIAGVFLLLTAVLVAILVVVALVTPVFVIVPMATTALALRLAGAGLIARTLLLALGGVVVLAGGLRMALSSVGVDLDWWTWVLAAAGGAFAARLVVELWKPDDAGRGDDSDDSDDGWRRWIRLGVVWIALAALAIVLVLLLVGLLPTTLAELVLDGEPGR
ncbi:hypothetical protein ABN034_07990 [Actinopolymorpha sp. B11F2]|uniref:hypothetical protein n=1 Tax=Actinopolymorpha sp. B11F2 TaxID=3160862 RepID=UPI0032E3BB5E